MDLIDFDNLNTDAFQSLHDMLTNDWCNDIRQIFGDRLSNEMIADSVQNASDFFNIDSPDVIAEHWTTGVYNNDTNLYSDDILIFNADELMSMGITGQDGLDLVMTHECAHRSLQGMNTGFSSHQEELCCDFMAGVRAGLNNIDVSQMENSLMFTLESETHPAGTARVESIESGVEFAREYYAQYNMAPTFEDCLENFIEQNIQDNDASMEIRESNVSFKGIFVNDKSWNEDQAKHYEWLEKRDYEAGKKAMERGDTKAGKDWVHSAKLNGDLANDYRESAKKSTKD